MYLTYIIHVSDNTVHEDIVFKAVVTPGYPSKICQIPKQDSLYVFFKNRR